MKSIFKTTLILLLIISFNSIDTTAKSVHQHKIGFLKSKLAGGNNGFCSYSITGGAKNRIVFYQSGLESSINIDDKEILLKRIKSKIVFSKQGELQSYTTTYNAGIFNIKSKLIVANAGNNASNNKLKRESGVINIRSTDGWQKKLNVECIREVIIGY